MARFKILCPQEYEGTKMQTAPCTKCSSGWDRRTGKCTVHTGAEHLDNVAAEDVPDCPIQDRCQHQLQAADLCEVRRKGLTCQSALETVMSAIEAAEHPLAFHADLF